VHTSSGCVCGRNFLAESNEGTCLLCGHGDVDDAVVRCRPRLRRLPRDLGGILREGRRLAPGRFENVRRG
jgi:hypothetical protein